MINEIYTSEERKWLVDNCDAVRVFMRKTDQPVQESQVKDGNMRDCPYPTEIFTEGQMESFCGCPIDDLNPNQSYNLSGVHLWQLLDGYRSLQKREYSQVTCAECNAIFSVGPNDIICKDCAQTDIEDGEGK
jgi:hypothetical protein